jgi:hypothetical protein
VALWFKDPFVLLTVSVDLDAGGDCACGVDTSKLSMSAANIIFVFIVVSLVSVSILRDRNADRRQVRDGEGFQAIDEMLDGFLVNDG